MLIRQLSYICCRLVWNVAYISKAYF